MTVIFSDMAESTAIIITQRVESVQWEDDLECTLAGQARLMNADESRNSSRHCFFGDIALRVLPSSVEILRNCNYAGQKRSIQCFARDLKPQLILTAIENASKYSRADLKRATGLLRLMNFAAHFAMFKGSHWQISLSITFINSDWRSRSYAGFQIFTEILSRTSLRESGKL